MPAVSRAARRARGLRIPGLARSGDGLGGLIGPASLAGLFLAAALTLPAAHAQTVPPNPPPGPVPAPAAEQAHRPRLGLVLSGGGARGLAHVGVLKVLEREHIPVDVITGTSMGAIIGGLYASGMSAEDLDRELTRIAWDRLFASRVDRQDLSQRRKEEDFEFSATIEFGLRNGEVRVPTGTLSSRGLEALLRRLTLPVRNVRQFDRLPTPFRAVATDMENGHERVLAEGDLALALRSSMSVPGIFAPVEWEDRILGDGGLVNNLPIDVAREMGADRLIAVNVGTPVGGRDSLNSLIGLTAQMINILTEQNVQRSIASMNAGEDLLVTPQLGKLTSGDFDKVRDFIKAGEDAAEALLPQLRAYAVDSRTYADWRLGRLGLKTPTVMLAAVKLEGTELTNPERLRSQLESKPGEAFNNEKAERDMRFLSSSGDYDRVDYHVEQRAEGETLVFNMDDKPWGPNYFRIGMDLSTDSGGDSFFNLRLSHNRHWLTDTGTEWRNQVTIGETPRLYTELYHPLGIKLGVADDWFVSGWAEANQRKQIIYDDSSRDLDSLGQARLVRRDAAIGFDLGQPWGRWGEVRLGAISRIRYAKPDLITTATSTPELGKLRWTSYERGIRLRTVVDQLDFANFPQHGYRFTVDASGGRQDNRNLTSGRFLRLNLDGTVVRSFGGHTLSFYAKGLAAQQPDDSGLGGDTLGGFHQLSGYQPNQLSGNALLFTRATYYRRLNDTPFLSRGFFLGGTLEAGNTWASRRDISLKDLRYASSVFLGSDTGLGPLYVGIGYAPRGGTAFYVFIGRP
ncbi:MAG: patatin-like phospholipase family protein [Mitsuaria chitosanitabida]|uniref:patatin-like phospholipase family protein n=1 Tax=Roseateles chitosanitabidus TaxID=65048 RepID=UPI001B06C517|nr:patatin-like phospholipase family protein [Roseateles chitosanitabidus]MBO9685926.1 patatin-like phospholipase family protein [Roseateles chitosanitabidus]